MLEILNCKEKDGAVIGEEKFNDLAKKKYGRSNFKGLEYCNANGDINPSTLAYRYTMDRMTYIRAKTIQQTFYTIDPTECVSVIPGEGAFASQIITQAN